VISKTTIRRVQKLAPKDLCAYIVNNERAWNAWPSPADMFEAAQSVGVSKDVIVRATLEMVHPVVRLMRYQEEALHVISTVERWLDDHDAVTNAELRGMGRDMQGIAVATGNSYAAHAVGDVALVAADGNYGFRAGFAASGTASAMAETALVSPEKWQAARERELAKLAARLRREDDGPLRWEVIDAAVGAMRR
jgi:hypothetical protein